MTLDLGAIARLAAEDRKVMVEGEAVPLRLAHREALLAYVSRLREALRSVEHWCPAPDGPCNVCAVLAEATEGNDGAD